MEQKEDQRILIRTNNYRLKRFRTEYPSGILVRGRGAEMVSAKFSDLYVIEKIEKLLDEEKFSQIASYEIVSEADGSKVIREGLMSGEQRAGHIFKALLEINEMSV